VAGIDLRIERGELLAFIGPNGASKSTTIKMLPGIL
jgi:ABC-2 type transport system ATP-binding protein